MAMASLFRHRIHSRRYNGRIEPDVGSELGSNVDFLEEPRNSLE